MRGVRACVRAGRAGHACVRAVRAGHACVRAGRAGHACACVRCGRGISKLTSGYPQERSESQISSHQVPGVRACVAAVASGGRAEMCVWRATRVARDISPSLHLPISPSLHPTIHVSIYLSIYLPMYLSMYLSMYPSICLSIYPCICQSIFCLSSDHLSIYPSLPPSIYLSILLCFYLSTCMSILHTPETASHVGVSCSATWLGSGSGVG